MSISTQKQIGIRRGKKKKTSSIENFGRPPPSEKERRPKRGVIEKSRGNRARTCPRPIYPPSPTRYSRERMLFARAFHPKPSRRIPDPRFCSRFLRSARKKNKSASFERSARKCTYLVKFVAFTAACPPTLELAPPTLVADARARASLSNRNARLRDIFYLRENVSAALFRLFLALFSLSLCLQREERGKKEGESKTLNPTQRDGKRKREKERRAALLDLSGRRRASEER